MSKVKTKHRWSSYYTFQLTGRSLLIIFIGIFYFFLCLGKNRVQLQYLFPIIAHQREKLIFSQVKKFRNVFSRLQMQKSFITTKSSRTIFSFFFINSEYFNEYFKVKQSNKINLSSNDHISCNENYMASPCLLFQ